jgi:hypothetical protein
VHNPHGYRRFTPRGGFMRTRLFIALAVAVVLTLVSGSPASASVSSPYGIDDVVGVNAPKGDIVALRVALTPTRVTFNLSLRRGIDVFNAHEWDKFSATEIRIAMDTHDGGAVDYRFRMEGDPSGLAADLTSFPGDNPVVCPVTVTQPEGSHTIRVRFARSCLTLDNPGELRARVTYAFDQHGDGTVDTTDRTPDAGFTPQIRFPEPS